MGYENVSERRDLRPDLGGLMFGYGGRIPWGVVPEGIGIPRNHGVECKDCRRCVVCGHVLLLAQRSVGDR